ncbi:MAG: hypothetical protein AAF436_07535, partial [Myxococcota bacterium]
KGSSTSGDSPETTPFVIRLGGTESVTEVYLWVGGENGECQRNEARNETNGTCGEIAGNPRSVGTDRQVGLGSGADALTLQNVIDAASGATNIVSCETSGLQGTPYEIFAFRNQAPGAMDVDPSGFGVTSFRVDVQPPNLPLINTTPQRQSTFRLSWGDPDPADLIQTWQFFFSTTDDPETATRLGISANTADRSQSIAASTLGLADGETGYIFMTAFDQAFVSERTTGGNESDLSPSVEVTNISTAGFCDLSGECAGCSASRVTIGEGSPGPVLWMLGLLIGMACFRRLRA